MRNHVATPERILLGAERAFAQLGYDATRVEDILEAAGVSRRTFYQRFSGKEAVAQVLWERAVDRILERVRERMDRASNPRQALVRALRAYADGWGEEMGPLRGLFVDSLRPGSPLAAKRRQGVRVLVEWLAGEAGKVHGAPPASAMVEHAILGLHGLLLDRQAGGARKRSAHAVREAAVAVAERVLLRP